MLHKDSSSYATGPHIYLLLALVDLCQKRLQHCLQTLIILLLNLRNKLTVALTLIVLKYFL
jgi:hypothetical protein